MRDIISHNSVSFFDIGQKCRAALVKRFIAAQPRPPLHGDPDQCFAADAILASIIPLEGSSAQFYRDEAKRIRALADACSLPDMKEQLITIADQFDRLAEQYEQGLRR